MFSEHAKSAPKYSKSSIPHPQQAQNCEKPTTHLPYVVISSPAAYHSPLFLILFLVNPIEGRLHPLNHNQEQGLLIVGEFLTSVSTQQSSFLC